MNDSHDRVETLLNHALEFKPAERAAFLARECGTNDELRRQVETLLQSADAAGGFMETATALEVSPLDDFSGRAIGRYKLLEKIGEGGWGVVYVAEQTEPVRRRVALKVIKLGMDTKANRKSTRIWTGS